jgi:mRNA-degrading endonuclease RelE of RelBE toxin-antitoxin system
LIDLINSLRDDPYQTNAQKMDNFGFPWRIYFAGNHFRLIYNIRPAQHSVTLLRAIPRDEKTYRER